MNVRKARERYLPINQVLHGNSLEVLKTLEENSVDSIVTDPPYELGFMNKKWDSTGIAYNVELWKECLRVLKPGGHLLAFGGTRTYHRMACAIEDAGFEIRDCIQWIYGSGFPKSLDISKAIDKRAGVEREKIGERVKLESFQYKGNNVYQTNGDKGKVTLDITVPATPEAKQWEGWGTALKPANEPIVLARKPLSEKTVAENVLRWGTGGINIDASRIAGYWERSTPWIDDIRGNRYNAKGNAKLARPPQKSHEKGRFPANVILDEEAGKLLDEQQEGASRFFYCAKASKKERNMGLEDMPEVISNDGRDKTLASGNVPHNRGNAPKKNHHPTVKPVTLIEYLIKLVTPPEGIVLDPFFGSGTTGVAAVNLGLNYIGIELDEQYVEIARRRINAAEKCLA